MAIVIKQWSKEPIMSTEIHEDASKIRNEVDHLFRHEHGKLVSILTKTFGPVNIELAEDVVQESMIEALNTWSYKGVPDNPIAWIYQVAKNKALNIINRKQHHQTYISERMKDASSGWSAESLLNNIFSDKEIEDDQLRMIFTCCHPSISSDSQVALTLKTLCGFSIPEISNAFLSSEENINKRLVRARKSIREAKVMFEVPAGLELDHRLSNVLETIYLIFNEGYNASSGKAFIRYELCEEAIRLAEILIAKPNLKNKSRIYALLSLMYLNVARFNSRINEFSELVDMEHQDRSKWDQKLIKKGIHFLEFSMKQNEVSIYHILATISAQHCTAKSIDTTDWEGILTLYDSLITIDNSPIVHLNRAVVLSRMKDFKTAIEILDQIEKDPIIKSYLPYYMSRAELHSQNNQVDLALQYLNKALELPLEERLKELIDSKIEEYSNKD